MFSLMRRLTTNFTTKNTNDFTKKLTNNVKFNFTSNFSKSFTSTIISKQATLLKTPTCIFVNNPFSKNCFSTTNPALEWSFMVKTHHTKKITRRNRRYRKMIEKNSLKRQTLMQLYRFPELPRFVREAAHNDLKAMSNNTSYITARRMCTILTRSRGLVHKFRVGRMVYRHYADRGQIAGLQRAKF